MSGAMLEQLSEKVLTDLTQRQMSLRVEEQADERGLEYLNNSNDLSTGGAAIFFYRFLNFEKLHNSGDSSHGANAHSNTDIRLNRVYDFWEKESNGAIKFNRTTHQCYLNNKKIGINGFFPGREGVVEPQDRTYSIVGQLVKLYQEDSYMKNDRTIYVRDIKANISNNQNGTILIAESPYFKKYKIIIIDKLDIDFDFLKRGDFNKIKNNKETYIIKILIDAGFNLKIEK